MQEVNKPLSQRQKQILKAVIESHIANGEPVGSKYLVENKQIASSSATIRNEMAELERRGYLEQPHTSAGRIPSEAGYRFYVDTLLEEYAMTTREIQEINEMMKAKVGELDQNLSMASKVTSAMTHYTAISVKPGDRQAVVKRFQTVRLDNHRFILVMISSTEAVQSKTISVQDELDEQSVAQIAEALNACIAGKREDEITAPVLVELGDRLGTNTSLVMPLLKLVHAFMNGDDSGKMNVTGMDRLLDYPEYSDMQELRQLIGTLEDKNDIVKLISEAEKDQSNVVIGSESDVKVMENSSLVFRPIQKDGKTIGAIGVIGPLRMDYARVLALLDTVTGHITNMLEEPSSAKLIPGETEQAQSKENS